MICNFSILPQIYTKISDLICFYLKMGWAFSHIKFFIKKTIDLNAFVLNPLAHFHFLRVPFFTMLLQNTLNSLKHRCHYSPESRCDYDNEYFQADNVVSSIMIYESFRWAIRVTVDASITVHIKLMPHPHRHKRCFWKPFLFFYDQKIYNGKRTKSLYKLPILPE